MNNDAPRLRRWATCLAVACLSLTACSAGDDSGGSPGSATSLSSSATASQSAPSSSSPPSTTPAEVGALLKGLRGTADVKIQIGTQCTVAGVARIGGQGSLRGRIDFRNGSDSNYVAANGRVDVTVPPGEPFPPLGPTKSSNPWGPGLSRIDPGVVPLVIADHAIDAEAKEGSGGAVVYGVTLDGPATLVDFGSDPSDDLPETVKYVVEVDAQGQVTTITAQFGDFGFDEVQFSAWR